MREKEKESERQRDMRKRDGKRERGREKRFQALSYFICCAKNSSPQMNCNFKMWLIFKLKFELNPWQLMSKFGKIKNNQKLSTFNCLWPVHGGPTNQTC